MKMKCHGLSGHDISRPYIKNQSTHNHFKIKERQKVGSRKSLFMKNFVIWDFISLLEYASHADAKASA